MIPILNYLIYQKICSGNIGGCVQCEDKKCIKCDSGYALSKEYICTLCPNNCKSCFYGGYYNNTSINWNSLQDKWPIYMIFDFTDAQYKLFCKECDFKYALSNNYETCDQCGFNCESCAFSNWSIFKIYLLNLCCFMNFFIR